MSDKLDRAISTTFKNMHIGIPTYIILSLALAKISKSFTNPNYLL